MGFKGTKRKTILCDRRIVISKAQVRPDVNTKVRGTVKLCGGFSIAVTSKIFGE